jgi:hypothetical protein
MSLSWRLLFRTVCTLEKMATPTNTAQKAYITIFKTVPRFHSPRSMPARVPVAAKDLHRGYYGLRLRA